MQNTRNVNDFAGDLVDHNIGKRRKHEFASPLFFAFTGLRTNIGTLHSSEMWGYLGLVLLIAIFGKLGGSMIASRLTGLSWREAGTVGVLMNTRGLVELVALNIGLDIGVISPTLFTIMVLMALITTFMTTPALHWIYPARLRQDDAHLASLRARPESAPYTDLT